MFNNVAIDVFTGLIFIFLLYSLLATIIMELIAHYMGLRPRLLVKALRRMLEDNPKEIFGTKTRWTAFDIITDFKEAVKRFFYPFKNLHFLESFYHHPTIKYLGESKSSSKPSYMHPGNFSQTIIQMFRGDNYKAPANQIKAIENYLFIEAPQILKEYIKNKHWITNWDLLQDLVNKSSNTIETLKEKITNYKNHPVRYIARKGLLDLLLDDIKNMNDIDEVKHYMAALNDAMIMMPKKISADTLRHFQNLFNDAQYDIDQFKLRLENWFNETMDRASGWYKKQTQFILLLLGFFIAVWGNIDTIKIYKSLAKDKQVREQMVDLAIQSQQKYSAAIDTFRKHSKKDSAIKSQAGTDSVILQTKVITTGDSVLDETYKVLQADIKSAGSIMGFGWCSSDSCKAYKLLEQRRDSLKEALAILKNSNNKSDSLIKEKQSQLDQLSAVVNEGYNKYKDKWDGRSVLGWLITALAICLGAPFWFDMLNKIIRLRGAGNKVDAAGNTGNASPASVLIKVNSQTTDEAIG